MTTLLARLFPKKRPTIADLQERIRQAKSDREIAAKMVEEAKRAAAELGAEAYLKGEQAPDSTPIFEAAARLAQVSEAERMLGEVLSEVTRAERKRDVEALVAEAKAITGIRTEAFVLRHQLNEMVQEHFLSVFDPATDRAREIRAKLMALGVPDVEAQEATTISRFGDTLWEGLGDEPFNAEKTAHAVKKLLAAFAAAGVAKTPTLPKRTTTTTPDAAPGEVFSLRPEALPAPAPQPVAPDPLEFMNADQRTAWHEKETQKVTKRRLELPDLPINRK